MIKYEHKKIDNEVIEHKESITEMGIELSIPGHKLRFFVDRKIITDKTLTKEDDNGLREHEETPRESGTSSKKSS